MPVAALPLVACGLGLTLSRAGGGLVHGGCRYVLRAHVGEAGVAISSENVTEKRK